MDCSQLYVRNWFERVNDVVVVVVCVFCCFVFFFNDTATTEIYTLSLHALFRSAKSLGAPDGRVWKAFFCQPQYQRNTVDPTN